MQCGCNIFHKASEDGTFETPDICSILQHSIRLENIFQLNMLSAGSPNNFYPRSVHGSIVEMLLEELGLCIEHNGGQPV
jgi:hypothetical protein